MSELRNKNYHQSAALLIGILLTLVAVVAHRLLPERRLILDGARKGAIYSVTHYGGGPPAEIHWVDQLALHFTCQLAEGAAGQNCVFSYLLYASDPSRGIDLSRFHTLNLVLRYVGDANYVRVGLRNFDPRFSRVEDHNSPKFNSANLRQEDLSQPVRISLAELTVPEWWQSQYDLPRELNRPDLSNATVFTIDLVGHQPGTRHEFRIDRIEFTGDWVSAESWYLGILCVWMMLAATYGASHWLLLRRTHREQRKKIHDLVDDNAQLQNEKALYQKLSTLDGLTKVLNRLGIEQFVQSVRTATPPISVIVIDLDHFKRVNDQRGHHVGDHVLQTVGEILRAHTRNSDGLGRWGGEEFVLICPGMNLPKAAELAEKMRHKILQTTFILEDPLAVTASFGVATSLGDEGFEETFRQADEALYLAKSRGRNCVVAATDDQMHTVTGVGKGAWAVMSGRFKMNPSR